jgi:ABC-type transport system substrate-binding protein
LFIKLLSLNPCFYILQLTNAELTSLANKIIDTLDQNRRKYAATVTLTETHTDYPRVQLTSEESKEIVNLTQMTCTCGVPITFSQPCTHVYLAAKTAGFPPKDMFTHCFFDMEASVSFQCELPSRFHK